MVCSRIEFGLTIMWLIQTMPQQPGLGKTDASSGFLWFVVIGSGIGFGLRVMGAMLAANIRYRQA